MLPMRLRRPACLVLPLVLVAIAAACGGGAGGGADAPPPAGPAVNAAGAELLPTEADALPEFDLDAYDALLGQLRGTPIVVNLWASWCGPCAEEAPRLAAAHAAYGERVQFLGVDVLDTADGARPFIARQGWRYPSVADPDGAIRDGLGLLGLPVTLFYGSDGTLVASYTGPIPEAELEARIAEILGG
mgnify:CR=1 FL=1